MFQQLSVDEKHTVDRDIFCLHEGHGELKEWLGQLQEVINLSPSIISDAELRVVMVIAVFINTVSQLARPPEHQERRVPACLHIVDWK